MHRRLWLLAGAGAAVLLLAASASATTKVAAGSARASTLAAAPFAQAWANVPRTPAARKAKSTLVFGMEQDITGFNLAQADETAYWAAVTGETPVIRGNYVVDQNGGYHLDLASSVTATKKDLSITIRPDANWYWGGKKLPVTNQDYVYTWKQFLDKNNNVASTTGYDQITGYTLKGTKQVTFHWKTPFADYRDLFGYIYPSKALKGLSFNTFWSNCVCGTDGKPVSDGPFYLSNYTKGQGVTLKANPLWYGTKPGLKEVDFKIITDTNSEIQAMRGGEVDAINPSPQSALSQLVHQSGLTYSAIPGFIQEHWDIQYGAKGNPLLKAPWMRQAIAMGMDRSSLVKALFAPIAPGLKPLNNTIWELGTNAVPSFAKWSFAPKKALALLAAHCTGGPSKPTRDNTAIWTCGGQKAEFRFNTTTGNQRRQTSAAIFSQQLGAIGIKLDVGFIPAGQYFGTVLPSNNFDLAEYAWVGGVDPSGFDAIYQCQKGTLGGQNYKLYCNNKVDALLKAGDSELNPTKRIADYQQAATITANDIAIIPLYASPSILVYKSTIKGMQDSNNPTSSGPTWNLEQWHW
ncbi:MAG: peptide ABC transporter substrate-binding protein [Gaiellaceae bacterium]